MKTIIVTIILCLFITGCGKKEYKPVRITINKDGTFLVDSKPSNISLLKKHLTDIMAEKGMNLPIIFIADGTTLFTVVEPVLLASAEAHAIYFNFQIAGTTKVEKCNSNFYPASRPPRSTINLEIKNNLFYIDNEKKSNTEITSLLSEKLDSKNIGLVLISCSGRTTFGTFYKFIEQCNQSEHVSAELQIMDKL